MKITKKVFKELIRPEPDTDKKAMIYLLGKKGENEPFSEAVLLEDTGGCYYAIPSIANSEITAAMLLMCQEGYTAFKMAWVTSQAYSKNIPIESNRVSFADYFKWKSGQEGVFIYPTLVFEVVRNKSVPVEIVE